MEDIYSDDQDKLSQSMYNGYLLLTDKSDFETLLEENGALWLPFRPDLTDKEACFEVKRVRAYYEKEEEYEICQELFLIEKKRCHED